MVRFVGSCKSLARLSSCKFLEKPLHNPQRGFAASFTGWNAAFQHSTLFKYPWKWQDLQWQEHWFSHWGNMVGSIIAGDMGAFQKWAMSDFAVGLCHQQRLRNSLKKKAGDGGFKEECTYWGRNFFHYYLRSCLQPLSLKLCKACLSRDSWEAEAHWQTEIW